MDKIKKFISDKGIGDAMELNRILRQCYSEGEFVKQDTI
jgi:hypothetical protein